jgi:diguanylate cyclase (GGDEF)-like protein
MGRSAATSNSDWSSAVIQRKRFNTSASSLAHMSESPTKIWRSRISWRIALSAFLTILVVQGGILLFTFKQQEMMLLSDIRENGRSVIAASIGNVTDLLSSPITQEQADRINSTTIVSGFTVYSLDFRLLGSYGEPVSMVMLDQDSLSKTYRSVDGGSYEVVYRSNDLRRPYIVVARLTSESVGPHLLDYIKQTLAIMLLMSAFVTVVLMISLSKWLLEPILFMRDGLLSAAESPESPTIKESPFNASDEIGGTILMAQNLIQQNAENIRQIKSAAEDKIHKLAYFDQLTGLPNRIQFLQKLTDQARTANDDDESRAKRFAVIAMDLDHFKDINDSMGHNVGDAILRGVGKRLRAGLPESAVVARSGEDEFAITMPLSTDMNSAKDVAERSRRSLSVRTFQGLQRKLSGTRIRRRFHIPR